jgi:hypothetical protein
VPRLLDRPDGAVVQKPAKGGDADTVGEERPSPGQREATAPSHSPAFRVIDKGGGSVLPLFVPYMERSQI